MSPSKSLRNEYLDWLEKKIERRGHDRECSEFLSDLHDVRFVSILPMDDNRALDGLALREEYIEEAGMDEHRAASDEGECSVLEMLIALASRMDFALYEPDIGTRFTSWFWVFIRNLRLATYDCDDRDKERKHHFNKLLINKFLRRRYLPNGLGGIFPLIHPKENQTEVEVWYQMMAYLDENYSIS